MLLCFGQGSKHDRHLSVCKLPLLIRGSPTDDGLLVERFERYTVVDGGRGLLRWLGAGSQPELVRVMGV